MRKTATIERVHCYGTPHHYFHLMYRGRVVSYWEKGYVVYAQTLTDDLESIQRLRDMARNQGFTHIRIAGDWDRRTKPKGGKL